MSTDDHTAALWALLENVTRLLGVIRVRVAGRFLNLPLGLVLGAEEGMSTVSQLAGDSQSSWNCRVSAIQRGH